MEQSTLAASGEPVKPRAVRDFSAVVEGLRLLTPDIMHVCLKLSEPPRIDFHPGQTIRLKVPTAPGQKEVARNYSIANSPDEGNRVELCVRHVRGGAGSGWVFTGLREGEEVRFNGPFGRFGLSSGAGPMVWVAGGSGIAPFWSMLRHMKSRSLARPCKLFLGAATPEDLPLRAELRQLEQELGWFEFIPAVAETPPCEAWDGPLGLVTEVVEQYVAAGEAGADGEAYLCGPPGLIDESVKVLTAKGYPPERIFIDKFAFVPRSS